jgi:hypothetical protein
VDESIDRSREERWTWGEGDYTISQCVSCVYKWSDRPGCAAFPDAIPDAILLNKHDHRQPYPGDGGVRYTPRPRPEE